MTHWGVSQDFAISHACEVADKVIDMIIASRIVDRDVLMDDSNENEDPTGFTPIGRELFEFIYGEVRRGF